MSYLITCDGVTLYDPTKKDYGLIGASLQTELNTSGTLTLNIPRSNASYGSTKLMKSVVSLYDDDTLIFSGRPYAPSYDLYSDSSLVIEGCLAYLNDSVYAPYNYSGTVSEFFTDLINNHNSQVDERRQFKIGNIDVTNSTEEGNITRSDTDYATTWSIVKDKLIDKIGGYLFIRYENDGTYIDYLTDGQTTINAPIELAVNLINASEETTTNELATVILPLGKQNDDDEYLTIESVNDGSLYVEDADAIERYGRIVKVVHHDDITLPSNLLRAGRKDLADALGLTTTYTIEAADLRKAGYDSFESFKLGNYVQVKVPTLEIDQSMLIKSLNIDLMNPARNTITIGDSFITSTENNRKTTNAIEEKIVDVNERASSRTLNATLKLLREVDSLIQSSAESLQSSFSEKYYDADNVDNLLREIRSTITQTAEGIRFDFNSFTASQNDVNDANALKFDEYAKYIQFSDGNIILGNRDSLITLRLQNDRIQFLENGVEVAYINNNKLNITNAEILTSLRLGNFAFVPRTTGNLSFKKVSG